MRKASHMLDVFLVKLGFLFGIHQIVQHRQQRHVFLARVRHQKIVQVLSEPAEFAPARGIEALRAHVADELDQRGADRADDAVLVSQMRADALIARFAEVGEQLSLFEGEMTLDLARQFGGKIARRASPPSDLSRRVRCPGSSQWSAPAAPTGR